MAILLLVDAHEPLGAQVCSTILATTLAGVISRSGRGSEPNFVFAAVHFCQENKLLSTIPCTVLATASVDLHST